MEFLDEQHGPDCKITYWRHPVFGILRVYTDHPRFGGPGGDVIWLWKAIEHEQAKIARRAARKAKRRVTKAKAA